MKHFSELTDKEVLEMQNVAQSTMISYAKKIGMSGLSEIGSHNLYAAVQNAIQGEHADAKKKRPNRNRKNRKRS